MRSTSLSASGHGGGWKRRIALAAILSLVISLVAIPAASATEPIGDKTWYVDSAAGDDFSADGSMANPFATITAAIATANAGDTVKVATDTTYAPTPRLDDPLQAGIGAPLGVEMFPLELKEGMTLTSYGDGERPLLIGEYRTGIMTINESDTRVEGLAFTQGSAPEGGAISVLFCSTEIVDCLFYDNIAAYGSAIGCGPSDVFIQSCEFYDNGWAPEKKPPPEIVPPMGVTPSFVTTGVIPLPWVEGIATGHGGAISGFGAWLGVIDCTLENNVAMWAGGGIYAEHCDLGVIGSTVTSNAAVAEPMLVDTQVRADAVFGEQTLSEYGGTGGGVAVVGEAEAYLGWSEFSRNWAWMPGGVFVDSMSSYEMWDCEVLANRGTFKGGGVASFPWVDPMNIRDRNVFDQRAYSTDSGYVSGNAFEMPRGDEPPPPGEWGNWVETTVFDGNVAPYGSALTSIMDSLLLVENCLFTENDTSDGMPDAAVSLMFTDAELWNNTFSQNTGLRANIVNYSASLVTLADPSAITDEAPFPSEYDVTVENTIFWANETEAVLNQTEADMTAATSPRPGYDTDGCWVDNSDSPLGDAWFPAGPSNIATDPLFADPDAGNFRLSEGSPCIDSGETTKAPTFYDLDYMDRPFDGDGDGDALHDMGCYEFFPASRTNGDNRYGTAVEISSASFGSADTVILATGEVFADGLAASGLCGAYGAPLLLTKPASVPAEVMAEIERLGATDIVIVGGPNAVSAAVVTQLEDAGLTVDRIAGNDRYETAVAIARELLDWWEDDFHGMVFVARGDRFPDALSVAPAAFWNAAPVLLVHPDSLPVQTVEVMETIADSTVIIAGGKAAVNTHVAKGLSVAAGDATRVSGTDRYETAVALSEFFVAQGWSDWGYTALATGETFADALTGGVAVGNDGGVMLLTPGASLHAATEAALTANKADIARFKVFGGGKAITPATMAAATAAVQ